jgi:uncharacterized protein YjbI with pentapeptide repeats
VNFVQVQFSGGVNLNEVQFSGGADFGGAKFFGPLADFGWARIGGYASFGGAEFNSHADFREAQFTGGDVRFGGAHFRRGANFYGARFSGGDVRFGLAEFSGGGTSFKKAQFSGRADFEGARFSDRADFGGAQFSGDVNFKEAQFSGDAYFSGARFSSHANFAATRFSGAVAEFAEAQFYGLCVLGPLRANLLNLRQAVFEAPAAIHAACSTITADEIRARDNLTLAGRGCDITLTTAQFDKPTRIATSPATVRFPLRSAANDQKPPRLLSVEDTDLSNITLAGIDLSACRFIGAFKLDQLHVDGPPNFEETPPGWRWSRRITLAEEHRWRASYDRRPGGWYPEQCRSGDRERPAHDRRAAKTAAAGVDAARVQAAYRELRKSFEDAKNEPGAADFYYGEMEMRRLGSRAATGPETSPAVTAADNKTSPRPSGRVSGRAEHTLLTMYWVVSGYGLRASRAMAALVLILVLATVVLTTVGLGRGRQIVYKPDTAATSASQPVTYRQTTAQTGKPGFRDATYYSIESATSLLRQPGTLPLTSTGRAIEIALRLHGPLLLGLAVLAIRGRVKR